MALSVLKFGGSFLGSINASTLRQQFLKIADFIKRAQASGNQVVVVISALAGETRRLKQLSREIVPDGGLQEEDIILSAGEQVTAGLLTRLLNSPEVAIKTQSLLAWQIPIVTDNCYGNAKIISISTDRIKELLAEDFVIVIPGFQGVTAEANITTLGFDGSDISAVALAGALKADYCQLYKDVGAVYSANPWRVHLAQKIPKIAYTDMHVLASLGAMVIHPAAVELAKQYSIEIRVVSSDSVNIQPGTIITNVPVTDNIVGVTYYYKDENCINVSVIGNGLMAGDKDKILELLQQNKIMAEIVTTDFSKNSITVRINWIEQLDPCIVALHSFFGLDATRREFNASADKLIKSPDPAICEDL